MNCSETIGIRIVGFAFASTVFLSGCSSAMVEEESENMKKMDAAASESTTTDAAVNDAAANDAAKTIVVAQANTAGNEVASTDSATVTLKAMNPKSATTTLDSMNPKKKEAPKPVASNSPPSPTPPGILDDMHLVQDGENLWWISSLRDVYDDPFLWPLIYKRNMDQIADPDLIYPGQELAIERDTSVDGLNAAAMHARNRGAWSVGPLEESDVDYTNSQSQ